MNETQPKDFFTQLMELLNEASNDTNRNPPDYIMADYIKDCLLALTRAIKARDEFYDIKNITKEPKTKYDGEQ